MHTGFLGNAYSYSPSYEPRVPTRVEGLGERLQTSKSQAEAPAETASGVAESFDVDALVDTVWNFVAQRLASEQATGADETRMAELKEAAVDGIKQGFSKAKDVLDELGMLDEDLTLKIDSAFGALMDRLDGVAENSAPSVEAPAANPPSSATVSSNAELYQYQQQTFALKLRTAQGDIVNIRSVYESSSSASQYADENKLVTQWSSSESGSFSLFVKGDLNDEELADIEALLNDIDELATEFYEGDMMSAFEMAQALNIDGTSLTSMNLRLTEVEQTKASYYQGVEDFGRAVAGEPPSLLPKTLEPLREYAEKLIAASEAQNNSRIAIDDFLTAMQNHPRMEKTGFDVIKKLLA